MQAVARALSMGLFALLSLFLIVFGVFYATVDNMLFFHAAAVPEEMRAGLLPLYLALMKLIGGAAAALGALCLFVTFGPLRNRAPFAATALALAIAAPVLVAAYVAESLAAQAGAPTSWHLMGVIIAVVCVAYLAHIIGARRQWAESDIRLPFEADAVRNQR